MRPSTSSPIVHSVPLSALLLNIFILISILFGLLFVVTIGAVLIVASSLVVACIVSGVVISMLFNRTHTKLRFSNQINQ